MSERSYIAIDLKSFYASVECVERNLDPIESQRKIVKVLGICEHVIESRKEELLKLDKLVKARFILLVSYTDDYPI